MKQVESFFNLPIGSVIGPLVICGTLIKKKDLFKLDRIKVKDSKLLTKKNREILSKKIKKIVKKYKIIIIKPKEIDKALNSDDLNLNWLEAHKCAEIINELKPHETIIDSPSNNPKAYKEYLKNLLSKKFKIRVEHKAERHSIVAAASIIAKHIRDKEIEKIEKRIGKCVGTGYISNEICRKFLIKNYKNYPNIFRKTWQPYKRLIDMDKNKRLNEY